MIYKANEEIEEMYLISDGVIEVGFSIQDDLNSVKYVKMIKSVDYIGEFYCLFNIKTKYFYRAVTEVKTFGINKDDLTKALEKHPELYSKFRTKCYRRYVDQIKSPLEKKIDEEINRFNQTNVNIQINKVQASQVKLYFNSSLDWAKMECWLID